MNKVAVFLTGLLFIMLLSFSFPSKSMEEENLDTREQVDGNISRVDYIDENGSIKMNDRVGYATALKVLDENGYPVEEYYLDELGNPVARSGGYYGLKRTYNEDGICTEYTYVNEDGMPVTITSGYATVKRKYNDQRQIVEECYFDTAGQQTALAAGQYGIRLEHNEKGRNDVVIFIDADGNPMENTRGYSTVRREFDTDGKITVEWYYDLEDTRVDIGRGQYGSRHIYENGQYVRSVPVDEKGRDVFYPDQLLQNTPWLVGTAAIVLVFLALILNRRAKIGLLVCYVLFIFGMTLLFRESGDQRMNLELFWSYRQLLDFSSMSLEVLNNIWLFVPLGALLCSLKPAPKILLFAVGLTLMIESIQYLFGLGLCELDDIIGNSLGAWLGWGCVREGKRLQCKWRSRRG